MDELSLPLHTAQVSWHTLTWSPDQAKGASEDLEAGTFADETVEDNPRALRLLQTYLRGLISLAVENAVHANQASHPERNPQTTAATCLPVFQDSFTGDDTHVTARGHRGRSAMENFDLTTDYSAASQGNMSIGYPISPRPDLELANSWQTQLPYHQRADAIAVVSDSRQWNSDIFQNSWNQPVPIVSGSHWPTQQNGSYGPANALQPTIVQQTPPQLEHGSESLWSDFE